MTAFDYNAPAELFRRSARGNIPMLYRRFATAAAAICFAVEEVGLNGSQLTTIQMDDERLDPKEIQALYDAGDYPLTRQVRSGQRPLVPR